MSFSEKDGTIKVTPPGRAEIEIQSHKDAAVDYGDASNSVAGAKGVVFHAEGANKPSLSFACVDGLEAARIRAACLDPATGKKLTGIRVSWALRRDGKSLSYRLTGCMLAEGGDVKASDGDGLAGNKAIKFLAKAVKQSINGAAFTRIA